MMARIAIRGLLVGSVLIAAGAMGAAAFRSRGMPEELRGMPPEVHETASEIQDIVSRQRGLIDKAAQAKTPEDRQAVFQAVARNVQVIANRRVVIMEQYAKLARARVEWARTNASEVRVSDLVQAMDEFAGQGPPRSPFEEERHAPPRGDRAVDHTGLPRELLGARERLKQTMARLQTLGKECRQAETDEHCDKLRNEIERHLEQLQQERITILALVLEVSERRLQWARRRAKEAGVPTATDL
jgi:hypothetical protein